MNKANQIVSLENLGNVLKESFKGDMDEIFYRARQENQWFTEENIILAVNGICEWLDSAKLNSWLNQYPDLPVSNPKRVGLILAGNIPLVGFHDVLCVLISGHQVCSKFSSKDTILMNFVRSKLIEIDSSFEEKWKIVEQMKDIDAIIATGSDNSARYFDYYFSKYPNIIRKNRTSVAVLFGNESDEDILNLGLDIFNYFGLGCRNVTYLFLQKEVDIIRCLRLWEKYTEIRNHNKYINNYEYYRSIYLVNRDTHLASDFLLLKEGEEIFSPVANIQYSYFENKEDLNLKLTPLDEKIQCIVSNIDLGVKTVSFGDTQKPALTDYADGVDTMKYLSSI